jgi:hypothetical protein
MDGMIRNMKRTYGVQFIDYQTRHVQADEDEGFLHDLIFTYAAMYELEKKYCPAIAEQRLRLAKQYEFPGTFPGVPLKMHPATGVGASENFCSRIHADSSIHGITETIMWTPPRKGKHMYFIVPDYKLAFDLSHMPCVILQAPHVPHGTANTGNHGGFGFVNVSKRSLLTDTPFLKAWYKTWNRHISTT